MIAVVDYGAGNLRSVANALEFIKAAYRVVRRPAEVDRATKILLPGVGHFGQMMAALQESGMDTALISKGRFGTPIFGICLGMQVLYESSQEAPGVPGLGLLQGEILRLPEGVKVPQMGWNGVHPLEGHASACPPELGKVDLAPPSGMDSFYYFANSFYAPVSEFTIDIAEYGVPMSATVQKGNIEGVQFHPEKSGENGLKLLKEWCERC